MTDYDTRHLRIKRTRGLAAEQVCADCGNQANEWSQIHGTDGEDVMHYVPRCYSCHKVYDQTNVGRRLSSQTIEKLRAANIRRKHTPETIEKIREGGRCGR